MTGREHYEKAERLLSGIPSPEGISRALAHAVLAQVAATIAASAGAHAQSAWDQLTFEKPEDNNGG